MKNINHLKKILVIAALATLTACGGGGGDSSPGATTMPPPSTGTGSPQPAPAPTPTSVINPLTGTAAPGTPIKTFYGTATAGASITAFPVKNDGSSGPALAPAVVADANGEFVITVAEAPMSMVRLVATGGSSRRNIDDTVQPSGTLQLVTPYVTSELGRFTISPLTDIAANVMASRLRKGESLADAFTNGIRTTLELDVANLFWLSDSTVHTNFLRGSLKSDKQYFTQESPGNQHLVRAMEALGVALDLPAQDVTRVVSASAESGYDATGIDGSGKEIVVGAWVAGKFDPKAPVTLKTLMDSKLLDSQKVAGSGGVKTTPRLKAYVNNNMIADFLMVSACGGFKGAYLNHYAFYQLDSSGNMQANDCQTAAANTQDLTARISTNNSSKMK